MYKRQLYQITLLSLIVLLLYNSAGCFLVFKLAQTFIQQRMDIRSTLPHQEEGLHAVSFNAAELKKICWLKKGKEFSFNGQHYDIVKIEIRDDRYTYWCIADEDEDHLFADFDRYDTTDVLHATKHKQAVKIITPFYPFYFINRKKQVFYLYVISIFSATTSLNHYPLVYLEVNHPPPSFS